MAKSFVLTIEGQNKRLTCSSEQALLQTLMENGVVLEADCGGRGSCGKCKIKVLDGQILDSNAVFVEPEPGRTYLACKSYPGGDITLSIKKVDTGDKGFSAKSKDYGYLGESQPLIVKKVLNPAYPSIDNNYSLQKMIKKALGNCETVINKTNVLRELALVLDKGANVLTVTLAGNEVIAVEAGDTANFLFGVAFDIGTTTVAGMLVDLSAKKVIATYSKTNPQTSFGADVISRIQAAADSGGLALQAEAIRRCLNQIIEKLCLDANINAGHIYAACIAGNATMSHLLLNISPAALTRLPYTQVFEDVGQFPPSEIGLKINPNGKIIILPNIASFIGSDTTAAIVAAGQDVLPVPRLLVDLGTNGEMALSDGKDVYVCSTAAGPAFEGAQIKDGMRAFAGAVSDVAVVDGELVFKVIGNVKPEGICGSGVVMAVAGLLKAGVITSSGRFNAPEKLPPGLRHRLHKKESGEWAFTLCQAEETASGKEICLTQGDIRQIQLVKSSILTGIGFLLEKIPEIEKIDVVLAGAFGNYIDIDSALAIGLLPKSKAGHVLSVGNAAGTGAVEALLSTAKFQRCANISHRVKYLELASKPDFQKKFVENLLLG